MTFESKFDIGETVYYYSVNTGQLLQGEIYNLSFYAEKNGGLSWLYGIIPPNEALTIAERVPENLIFRERGDILDFCMKLTENI